MFAYAVSNPLLDRYDPYWVCRLSALKVAYVCVVVFILNAFFKSPTVPVLQMLVTAVAVSATELPPINSQKKKILAYIGVIVLCVTTNTLFGLVSYFKWGQLIAIGAWTFVLYHFIAKDGATANIVGVLVLIGIVSLEGGVATDFNGAINHIFFYIEYAAVGLMALVLFPNMHDHIVKSAALRLLELDRRWLMGNFSLQEFEEQTIASLLMIENQANQVSPAIYALMPILKSLQLEIRADLSLAQQRNEVLLAQVEEIYEAIKSLQRVPSVENISSGHDVLDSKISQTLRDLAKYWNAQCLA